ncbi:MAG: DUF2726 domain-containing protein [Notoacmeibacter sp.]|nr:DUF2726 domain-containing protein [Notoacmeibacter sp.]
MQRQIRAVIKRHGAELHEKVRIADIIDISKLDTRDLGTYALQAHFDFVLIDENQRAVVAVEFDGPGHDPTNDGKKDSICQQADLPLIRVYGFEEVRRIKTMTLVSYLVELVFHARVFAQMKEEGKISSDEPFVLSGFLKPDAKHIFDSEFDFVGNTNGKLTRALQRGGLAADELPHWSISRLMLRAPDGRLHAFMSINSSKGPIVGTASLRVILASWGFLANLWTVTFEIAQFADGMAADNLLENIRLVVEGHGHVVTSTDEVLAELKTLGSLGYTLVMGSGGGDTDLHLLAAFEAGKGDN